MTDEPRKNVRIHPSADVSARASIGEGTAIWQQSQVREGASIGSRCVIGKCVYIGADVVIGDCCKIENHASLHEGIVLEHGVFIGPHVVLTNDKSAAGHQPGRQLEIGGRLGDGPHPHRLRRRRSAPAGVVLPDVTIGRFALVGAGSVVTHDVPPHGLVLGNPARLIGYVCSRGHRLVQEQDGTWCCPRCGEKVSQ